ncbi:MAG: hypothetical protein JNM09_19955 [Blastocatellia bacterium]|nr:hypothetical protein [Blastocatellia bacterium]
MQLLSHFVLVGVIALFAPLKLSAQEANDSAKPKQAETMQKAQEALPLVIVEARALKLPENRAAVLAQAFALLWPHDEKAARELIPEITGNLKQMFSKVDENQQQNRFYQVRKSTREQAVNQIAKVDLELALEMLRATRPPLNAESAIKDLQQSDLNVEQNLANQIAAHNPDVALKLAEQSLEKGFSYSLRPLLTTIQKKSPEKATSLLDKIYKKLQTEDVLLSNEARFFASSFLVEEFRAHKKELPKGHELQGIKLREPLLGKEDLKKWTDTFVRPYLSLPNRIDAMREKSNVLGSLQMVSPFLDFVSPELMQPVNMMLSKIRPKLSDHEKERFDAEHLRTQGKVDELVAMAEKLPKERRDGFLWNAIMAAIDYLGDPDLATKIIDNHVTSDEKKKQYRDFVAWINSYLLAEQGKIDEVIASLAHITRDAEKARTLARIAESNVKSRPAKIQLLERAVQYLGDSIDTGESFSVHCYIIGIYAQVDSERAFALLEPQIDPMNRVWEAAANYCTFDGGFVCLARKGELLMSPNFNSSRFIFDVVNAIRGVGKVNFARAYELAQQIKSPEIRSQALIAMIESNLVRSEEK